VRIVFAGTPAFALPTLRSLHRNGYSIVAVYTQPDRPAGRGRKLHPSPIKEYALANGITVRQPQKIATEQTRLAELDADAMVVAAYGLILPPAVLAIPRNGCINVHASLLPRWRGAAPIARSIEAGDRETGITIMQMEAGLDTGPILLQVSIPISSTDTSAALEERLATLGADTMLTALERLQAGALAPTRQQESLATYAPKLKKEESSIDWSRSAAELHCKVRAFNPWPVATTTWRGETLRVWDVGALSRETIRGIPGTVFAIDDGVRVQTGDGVLNLQRLQLAGGRALAVRDFLNGAPIRVGERLGV
jgi:methionyl-tRNA formyltransferase